ncbi:hypothetical protein ACT7DC_01315 [Bacillus cereus]
MTVFAMLFVVLIHEFDIPDFLFCNRDSIIKLVKHNEINKSVINIKLLVSLKIHLILGYIKFLIIGFIEKKVIINRVKVIFIVFFFFN